ncbi:MAG TPA: ABC transporter substrate-binding protein [Xanthobacteraceae bacterium]|jgi:ABC-type nitrate/sulfonate/bicarbonate transport system substrate-binding protein
MQKLIFAVVAVFSSVALLHSESVAQDTIKVGYAIQAHQANMMVLPRFAEKYGLKVDLVAMRRFPDLQLALTTHQVDAAVLGYVNMALMEERNIKSYKVISGVYVAPGSLVLAPEVEDKVKTWKDLEGKSLGTAPNGAVDIVFRALLKQQNVDQSKIKMVSFGALGPPLLTALKDRDIDGFIAWEPNNADAVVGKLGVYSHLDIGANPSKGIQGILVVDETFAGNNDRITGNLVRALVDATDHLNNNPKEWADIAFKATGSSLDVLQVALPHGRLDTSLYRNESEALLDMIYKAGLTKGPTVNAVGEHFEYRWLMAATGKPASQLGGR